LTIRAEERLYRLFEDIRGYAAPMNLSCEQYDLAKVWRTVWQQLATQRQSRAIELRELTPEVDPTCTVDLFSLERVFRNIFENSLAACHDPVIIDIACAETTMKAQPALRISVGDNGPGLSPEQKRRIFDPFFTTKRQGTGLGMAIAKRIVEAHGGVIGIGDSDRKGAEILITLPRG
jgi:two-component system, LuxR family, sensor kinase FixL